MVESDFQQVFGLLFAQYREVVKPLVAEVEAVYERFPIPIYNEIRSFNDHVSRCFNSEGQFAGRDTIEVEARKAQHHTKRTILDCYKLLSIADKQTVEGFEKKTAMLDLRAVDETGEFSAKYSAALAGATNAVAIAKKTDASGNTAEAYEAFQEAHNAYAEVITIINANMYRVVRVRRKPWKGRAAWILWSLITFAIGCVLTNNNQMILEWLRSALLGLC